MSAIKIHPLKNYKYDTNTITEPVYMCACGKRYVVDDGCMSKYIIYEQDGQEWIDIEGCGKFPIKEMNKG